MTTTPTPTFFHLGRSRRRSRLWRRAVFFAAGAILAGSNAAPAPIASARAVYSSSPGLHESPAQRASPAGAPKGDPEPLTPHEAKLTASGGGDLDRFGYSVALSGERALIGAYDSGVGPGAAYVFERQGHGTWAEVSKLTASDGAFQDYFGVSVALSGGRVLIGAVLGDNDGGSDAGSAYVFERQADGTWAEVVKLTASDGASDDHFGDFVALSGGRVLIGARWDDDLGSLSGSAYVFERQEDGIWTGPAGLGRCGAAVSSSDAAGGPSLSMTWRCQTDSELDVRYASCD